MDHDRLFKELLRTFFVEFIELFLPEVAAYLDPASIEFLDKEVFTDVTAGDRHEVDLLVKARFRGGTAYFLIHVENQSSAAPGGRPFGKRLFRYFARIDEAHDLPVYPIVVFSYDAPPRPEPDEYRVAFPDMTVLVFKFRVIQLNRLDWRDFVNRPNPVAAALMARMRVAPEDRPRVKLQCLRLLATLKLDRARMQLISGFVDSYLRLNAQEQQMFDSDLAAIAPAEQETVMELTTSWKEEGLRQGLQQGLQQGRRQAAQDIVLRLLARRFGPLSADLEGRVRQLATPAVEELADALLGFAGMTEAEAWVAARG